MKYISILIFAVGMIAFSCNTGKQQVKKEVIIFHAGSLSVPLKQIAQEYEKRNQGVKILMESAGSLVCARKVTELKKPCDIVASSDYFVINEMLMPAYTDWGIRFATNEIVIAFQDHSKYSSEINSDNWMDILLRDDVIFSRSDPDADPCGYRTVFTFMLAEKFYNKPGLAEKMSVKNKEYIRPKEVDLVAMLESKAIDYMFQYKSVSIQHNLRFVELPGEMNLSDPSKNEIYRTVSMDVAASAPGTKMKVTGECINYSLTIIRNAPQKEQAIDFLDFILSKEGMEIFKKNGQKPIIPFSTEQPDKIPQQLLRYLEST